jgi:hypothetical protein
MLTQCAKTSLLTEISQGVYTDFRDIYCDKNTRHHEPTYDHSGHRFSPMDFQRAGSVLLDRQRRERELLRMPLSGYASVYNVNTCFQLGGDKCSRQARGARG